MGHALHRWIDEGQICRQQRLRKKMSQDRAIPETMQAAVYRGVNDVRVETVPVPRIGAGEVLLRVATCGVCGTDLKKIHTGSHSAPRIFGHEIAATIAAKGRGRRGFRSGRSRHGLPPRAVRRLLLLPQEDLRPVSVYKKVGCTAGFEPSGGGFAEYVRVMDWIVRRGLVKLPKSLPFEQAAFIEPLNTTYKGVRALRLQQDETVLVIGQGPIGILLATLARRTGAKVVTSDLYPQRHAVARTYGLEHPIDASKEDVVARIREESERPRRRRGSAGCGRQRADPYGHRCGASRRTHHAVCADAARRGELRSGCGLHGREDADGLVQLIC